MKFMPNPNTSTFNLLFIKKLSLPPLAGNTYQRKITTIKLIKKITVQTKCYPLSEP